MPTPSPSSGPSTSCWGRRIDDPPAFRPFGSFDSSRSGAKRSLRDLLRAAPWPCRVMRYVRKTGDGAVRLYGLGIARGMLVTLGHFLGTYVEGFRRATGLAPKGKSGPGAGGILTVQYPEERMPVQERFRVLPVLLYDPETGEPRCTACGICAKVCPPQCIWIVQARGSDGKPRNKPAEFSIEPDVCMNCGLCAEHCPFGAIRMDHRFELAVRERRQGVALTMTDLLVSEEYWAKTHPKAWAEEESKRPKLK